MCNCGCSRCEECPYKKCEVCGKEYDWNNINYNSLESMKYEELYNMYICPNCFYLAKPLYKKHYINGKGKNFKVLEDILDIVKSKRKKNKKKK